MSEQLLKGLQVAQTLNISRSQTSYLMKIGAIKTVRFRKLIRVRPQDLEEFIAKSINESIQSKYNTRLAVLAASLGKVNNHPEILGGLSHAKF